VAGSEFQKRCIECPQKNLASSELYIKYGDRKVVSNGPGAWCLALLLDATSSENGCSAISYFACFGLLRWRVSSCKQERGKF
jgi:hypothetical protein